MSYVAIMAVDADGRVTKYQIGFSAKADAEGHVADHNGILAAPLPDAALRDWKVVDGALTVDPVVVPVMAEDVIAERDRRINEGTTINVPGIGDIPVSGSPVVQADLTSLAQAAQIAIAAGNPEAMFPFRDRAGATHALTPEQVVSLFMSGVDWLASMRAAAWALIDADPIPADFADDRHWPAP